MSITVIGRMTWSCSEVIHAFGRKLTLKAANEQREWRPAPIAR